MARLAKEASASVFVRPGNRKFLDQDCPFSEAVIEEIVRRQTAFEEIQGFVAQVYNDTRCGVDWKRLEVPECLVEVEQKAEQRAAEPAKPDTSPTSSSESPSKSKTKRVKAQSTSRGASST